MSARLTFPTTAPDAYEAVLALSKFAAAHVDHDLGELVKLRASMRNGCSFCVDMHGSQLLADGEDVRRVMAVAAWRESTLFTDRERAALALTDEVTVLGEHGVADGTWASARDHFDETGVAHLLVLIAVINVWNRIQVATQAPTPQRPLVVS